MSSLLGNEIKMPNFEYENFYKFIVSLGIGLIAIALLLFGFFLTHPFDLLQKEIDIQSLTQFAQTIIQLRQMAAGVLITLSPVFTCCFGSIGVVISSTGSWVWWRKTQKAQDEQLELQLERIRRELTPASEIDKQNKRKDEAIEELQLKALEHFNKSLEYSTDVGDHVTKAISIEQKIISLFRQCLGSSHEVLANQRLGNAYFDLTLLAKDPFAKSYVVEMKYIRGKISYNWLRDNALRLSNLIRLFQIEANQAPIPVLLVIAPGSILSTTNSANLLSLIEQERIFRKGKSRIIFLVEEEIDTLTCNQLHKLL